MARTIEEIRIALCEKFVSQPAIQQAYGIAPNSSFEDEFSKVSFESIFFFTVATGIYTLEKLFDVHKDWVEKRALELKWGSLAWYVTTAKSFQYGDALVFEDDVYKYHEVNIDNQIVKLAAATESGNKILLKVAGENQDGTAIALPAQQLDALKAFIKKQKPPGIEVNTVSRDADLLMIHYHVYIDALVLDENGALISDPNEKPVEQAINNYIKNLPFDGVFSVTELTDLIQQGQGVINPVFDSVQTKFGTNNYASFSDYYTPNAGYLKIDEAHPLSTTITYVLQ